MKVPAVLVFLGTVLLILSAIHAYLYLSFVTFFEITSPAVRRILAVLLGFLAVSFVLASVGTRVLPGIASQTFYALASVWFGATHFLFFASLAVWPIVAAERWLPFPGIASLPRQAAILPIRLDSPLRDLQCRERPPFAGDAPWRRAGEPPGVLEGEEGGPPLRPAPRSLPGRRLFERRGGEDTRVEA